MLDKIAVEHIRRASEWRGAERTQPSAAFLHLIADYVGWAQAPACEGSPVEARQRLVKVESLAIVVVEMLDEGGSGRAPARTIRRRRAGRRTRAPRRGARN